MFASAIGEQSAEPSVSLSQLLDLQLEWVFYKRIKYSQYLVAVKNHLVYVKMFVAKRFIEAPTTNVFLSAAY